MEELASWLLSLRQEAKIELATLAEKTKIQRRHLEALEAGQWESLPSPVHVRAFALAHARACGADEGEAIERVQAAFASSTAPSKNLSEPASRGALESEALVPRALRSRAEAWPWKLWLTVGIAAIALLLLVNAGISALRHSLPPAAIADATATSSAAGPGNAGEGQATSPLAAAAATSDSVQVGEALDLRSRRPCWVVLEIDGKRLPTIFLEPEVRERWTVMSKAVMLAGNIGAVRVWWRGENLGYFGELGDRMNGIVFEPGKPWRKDETENLALPPGVPSQAPPP